MGSQPLQGVQHPLPPHYSRWEAAGGIGLQQQKGTRASEFHFSLSRPEREGRHKRLLTSLKYQKALSFPLS